ncbi:MAG TPA: TIGR03560 family F420-dependent LLM class oxidoreductase [Thermomicrobiales bacterium]|jgi:F420-dependent oxidoreductase-like protein|nr:TIGR03560 family F420-dependent LLM class oxidoreductase [Thermomicrobiales bacterium]
MRPLSFGFKTAQQHSTWEEILAVWKEADDIPAFEHGWLFDHLNPIDSDEGIGPCFEGWTMLTALATHTKRLRLGLLTGCNTYRDPALHAQIAATADVISGGRIDFGDGAGWNEYEHRSRNIELPAPGKRLRMLEEAIEITKALWTQEKVDYDGTYYQLHGARLEPKPVQKPHPPILIGGSGEQVTLKIVAKHADIWNYAGGDIETFRHKVEVLKGHCETVGRDFGEIQLSAQRRIDINDIEGTIADAQAFIDAGVTHMVFYLSPPYTTGMVTTLAEQVIPKLEQR